MLDQNDLQAIARLIDAKFKVQQDEIDAKFKVQQDEFDAKFKVQQDEFDAKFKVQQDEFDAKLKVQQNELVEVIRQQTDALISMMDSKIRESETRTRVFIENSVTNKIEALFDGYKLTHEKQWELERKVEKLEERVGRLEQVG